MQFKRQNKKGEIKRRLREMIPSANMEDFIAIEEIANSGHLRHLPPSIRVWQATTTHARHAHTEYDALLDEGYDQESARHFVLDDINAILQSWGCTKRLTDEEI